MSFFHENMLIGSSGQGGAAGYQIERSLRFNSADASFLSRTPASAGNRRTWTWAGWMKLGTLGGYRHIFGVTEDRFTSNFHALFWDSGKLSFQSYSVAYRQTTQLLRDHSAWYHIVLAVDTTQATGSNRVKIYINGSQVTNFDLSSDPAQNLEFSINSSIQHTIGRDVTQGTYFDGYLADVHFIDGQALTPTSFGEFDTNNVWQPKAYSGTYGTNGFKLDFSNPLALGNDAAGTNDWTPNNVSGVTGGPTSVAAASGALPIYNTTDTYGAIKGTGTRTDVNGASISVALPMEGANNSTTFIDESATIKGSGLAKTITANSGAKISTAQSKYYGSSGYFDNALGSYLSWTGDDSIRFGTGDFTVEFFARFNSSQVTNAGVYSYGGHATANALAVMLNGATLPTNMRVDWNGSTSQLVTSGTPVRADVWQHHALVRSGTTATYYVDGVAVGSVSNNVNFETPATNTAFIGARVGLSGYKINGYIQDFRIYKGVAKYTGNFNPPSSTQDLTLAAGNDSLVDSPTNYGTDTGAGGEARGNYCTWNPVDRRSIGSAAFSFTNGNLEAVNVTNAYGNIAGTIFASSGKWYWEIVTTGAVNGTYDYIGIIADNSSRADAYPSNTSNSYWYRPDGKTVKNLDGNTGVAYGASWVSGDVIGVALDADNKTLTFYKNGVSQGVAFTGLDPSASWTPAVGDFSNALTLTSWIANFGQRQWAYAPPAGFKALCTQNLPTPTITNGATAMDVKLYTGTGASQTISGLGFSPDFIWTKARSVANSHFLYDVLRVNPGSSPANKPYYLRTDTTASESVSAGITSFDSNGFTLDGNSSTSTLNATYAAWCWDAGSSTVTNTSGTISSQVRANASAGFSIVTYTGTGANATVGHGLGVAPQLILVKCRDVAREWFIYSAAVGATRYLQFTTATAVTSSTAWNNTAPTSTVFSLGGLGGVNALTETHVAYCWAPVAGYSSFGSYAGNDSTDGPMIFTSFRPRWLLLKSATAYTSQWHILDSSRSSFNVATAGLNANTSGAEGVGTAVDFLSNGFKLRQLGEYNTAGATYIWAAFAEHPFALARAR